MVRFVLPVILVSLIFNLCSPKPPDNSNRNNANQSVAHPGEPAKTVVTDELRREPAGEGVEVTFFPAYGYRSGTDWVLPIRSWVHQDRPLHARAATDIAALILKCTGPEKEVLSVRLADFPDNDKHLDKVTIQFDSDPDREEYRLGRSDANGLVEEVLRLPEAKAKKLLESQGRSKQWLTYHTVTRGQTGKGRVRLIEPEGVSVITDIDDTIKVTGVPGEHSILLRNTFCLDFVPAPGMADMYRGLADTPFHYVSGGPWQLYGPLYDFLISGPAGYPEGTFHFSDFPKNVFGKGTIENLFQGFTNSLQKTYDHKFDQIGILLNNFPKRKFILIGDSGELDPEVYRAIREKHSGQIQEIRIRDVVNDEMVNKERLQGMTIIKAQPIICASKDHLEKLSEMMAHLQRPTYKPNKLPPCT
jgi:hypothetical protein